MDFPAAEYRLVAQGSLEPDGFRACPVRLVARPGDARVGTGPHDKAPTVHGCCWGLARGKTSVIPGQTGRKAEPACRVVFREYARRVSKSLQGTQRGLLSARPGWKGGGLPDKRRHALRVTRSGRYGRRRELSGGRPVPRTAGDISPFVLSRTASLPGKRRAGGRSVPRLRPPCSGRAGGAEPEAGPR